MKTSFDDVRQQVDASRPGEAFALAARELARRPDDAAMRLGAALALAQAGDATAAAACAPPLDAADLSAELRDQTLALRLELAESAFRQTADQSALRAAVNDLAATLPNPRAHGEVSLADGVSPILWAGAACLAGGAGCEMWASAWAEAAVAGLRGRDDPESQAALGKAQWARGDLDAAAASLTAAVAGLGTPSHATRETVARWRRGLYPLVAQHESDALLAIVDPGGVAAFSGHMIDQPGTGAHRFPADPALERRVASAIESTLDRESVTLGVSSGACGSDILFAEAILARGGELELALPFEREEFINKSVDFGFAERASWRARFEAVAARATVHMATTTGYLHESYLFTFCDELIQGLAVIAGQARCVDPLALVVLDPGTANATTGAAGFVKRWQGFGGQAKVVDLAALRRDALKAKPAGAHSPHPAERSVKSTLTAALRTPWPVREDLAPAMAHTFLQTAKTVLDALPDPPDVVETHADRFTLVFDQELAAASCASALASAWRAVDWSQWEQPRGVGVAIGLDTAPLWAESDPLAGRPLFAGRRADAAARLVELAPPGCALASETFAAALASTAGHAFRFTRVGASDVYALHA